MVIIGLIIFWFLCGFIHYGFWIATMKKYYEIDQEDHMWAFGTSCLGPISLITDIPSGFFKNGWKLK